MICVRGNLDTGIESALEKRTGARRREGTYASLWLICLVVWQKPTQHCKAIFLQLKKKKCSRKTERVRLRAQNGKLRCCTVKILRLLNVLTYCCSCFMVVVKSLSPVQLFATPWTIARWAPLSMGFSRQDTGMGCHFLPQGIFPSQGSNLCLLH